MTSPPKNIDIVSQGNSLSPSSEEKSNEIEFESEGSNNTNNEPKTGEDVMNILIRNILGCQDDHPIQKALSQEGAYSFDIFALLSEPDFRNLRYTNRDGRLASLGTIHLCQLTKLHNWSLHTAREASEFDSDALYHLFSRFSPNDFLEWTVKMKVPPTPTVGYKPTTPSTPQSTPVGNINVTPSPVKSKSAAQEFQRATKRDKTNYPQLKSEKDWDTFHRKVLIQAHADGVANILNKDWSPKDQDQADLDKAQNAYR